MINNILAVCAVISAIVSVLSLICILAMSQELYQFYCDAKFWSHMDRKHREKVEKSLYNARKRDVTMRSQLTKILGSLTGNHLDITGSDGKKTHAIVIKKK